jgi:hypothetical protein
MCIAAAALGGCDLGHPGGFTARSNSYCAETRSAISALSTPNTAKARLQFATDRYGYVERLVSELTDSSLPGGAAGAELDDRWLHPARASLLSGRTVLADLRTALKDPAAATVDSTAFTRSLAIGTENVDTALLRSRGLTRCASAFEPTMR